MFYGFRFLSVGGCLGDGELAGVGPQKVGPGIFCGEVWR